MTHSPAREHRWIVLGEDGRHVTLGRHTDPTDDEIARSAEALRTTGQGGWLAVLEGRYYQPRDKVSLLMVRQLGPTKTAWEAAAEAFLAARRRATAPRTG